ncbi:MAG: 4-alpha-glucanotransferase [Endozoicomonas sp.]
MPDLKMVERLAELCEVSGEYLDWAGNPVSVTTEYKIPLLQAMGLDLTDDAAIERAIEQRQAADWEQLLPPVIVLHEGQPFCLNMHVPEGRLNSNFKGELELEDGKRRPFAVKADSLVEVDRKALKAKDIVRLSVPLPDDLPYGYHRLSLKNRNLEGHSLVIVAPKTCYEPESLGRGEKLWGSSIQLYTVRTAQNWGMGDFTSLKQLAGKLAAEGANIVGLNPIHSLFPSNPLHASPYSPSSRNFINPLYIDVTAIPEFVDCQEARSIVDSEEFQRKLKAAREIAYVDYDRVASLKYQVLTTLFEHFNETHIKAKTARGKAFQKFCKLRGDSQERHATFEALYEHFRSQDEYSWGWPSWKEEFQTPDSQAVKDFARTHKSKIHYFMYLQWVAEIQLAEAQQAAVDAGMTVGIYRDLAVGVDSSGADVWSNRSAYCLEAGVGAPPDGVAPQGQSWGLPPFNPLSMKEHHYAPFIEMVRSNMSHCGALRIDHVMGLLRLWWCPAGKTADYGAYVYYPFEDMLGIIKLESQRRGCLVFGEDLGTVPPEVEASLPQALCYSNEVVLFSSEGDHFLMPEEFKPQALTCVSNHDIPTLKAWWECLDLDLRHELGIYDAERTETEKQARHDDKMALLKTLGDIGEMPWGVSPEDLSTLGYSRDVMEKIHYYLAKTASKIVVVQLEDILQVETPVNVPGTCDEYPNWRRKLTDDIENLFADEANKAFFGNLNVIRKG